MAKSRPADRETAEEQARTASFSRSPMMRGVTDREADPLDRRGENDAIAIGDVATRTEAWR